MSDVQDSAAGSPSSVETNPLRHLREQAGMNVTTLAVMLKVSPQKLEALEAGRYADLPNMTFARALATSVCRVLKVDPAQVLSTLPQPQSVHIRQSDEGLNTPFPVTGGSSTAAGLNALLPLLKRPVLWMVLVLVLAGLMWVWLPDNLNQLTQFTEPSTEVLVQPPSEVDELPVPAPAPEVSAAPVESVPTQGAVNQLAAVAASEEQLAPQVPAANGVPSQASEQNTPILTLRVHAPSWVQVTGGSGRLLLQRTLQPAEEVSFGADLPLSVVLGRADVAEVKVRGAAFDLAPYVRNRVARFEVN